MSYKKVLITSNNSYCESYKRALIQSSNPIQFLDPTKFRTLTLSGVSFVSSNGIITANGTATGPIYFAVQTLKMDVFVGHKMLLTGCPSGGSAQKYYLYDSGDDAHSVDVGGGAIYPITVNRSTYIYIYIAKGYVATNLQFKPQFYDLTATFGAGNEPTTLAAFRAKFPNKVYPYNPSYCESYKKALISFSNPIQLTDPTKFRTTKMNGISFTASGGVITANGTAANEAWFNTMPETQFPLQVGHKMLLIGCPSGGSVQRYLMRLADSNDDMGSGKIFSANNNILTLRIYIKTGYTATNLQFKPQLFDLTQMFGEGNEPTTVAEFRAKFPNEIYPYVPYNYI